MVKTIIQGDSTRWAAQVPEAYREGRAELLICGPESVTLEPTVQDEQVLFILDSGRSAKLVAGIYSVCLRYVLEPEQWTTVLEQLQVLPDPTTVTDHRTLAQRALEECDQALATFNASGGRVASYSIGGRAMTFSSVDEILRLRTMWQRRRCNELAASGHDPSKRLVRFV